MKKVNVTGNQKRKKNTRETMKKRNKQAHKEVSGNTRQHGGDSETPIKVLEMRAQKIQEKRDKK